MAGGVIHDIGYRRYDGPRLGRWAVVRALYLDSLRGAFGLGRSARSKVAPFLLVGVIVVPALVITIMLNTTGVTELLLPMPSYAVYVYPLLILYVGGQAPAGVSRDLRFRVTTLYFSRSLRRSDYVAAKYAALTTATTAVLVLPLSVMLGGGLLSEVPAGDVLTSYAQGLLGAVLLAVMVSGIGLVIASVTPRRGLGVAAVVAVLVVLWALQGIIQALVQEQGRADLAYWTQLISPVTVVDGLTAWAFGIAPASGLAPAGAVGLVWAAAVPAVAGGSGALLLARYREVSVT